MWQLVKENIYTHRHRKEQDEDDIMICQCRRPPSDGGPGCGPDCLNRMLNVECVPVRSLQAEKFRLACCSCARPCMLLPDALSRWQRQEVDNASPLQGYCPCEERCSNQMFSKRQYAKLEKVGLHCFLAPALRLRPMDGRSCQESFRSIADAS